MLCDNRREIIRDKNVEDEECHPITCRQLNTDLRLHNVSRVVGYRTKEQTGQQQPLHMSQRLAFLRDRTLAAAMSYLLNPIDIQLMICSSDFEWEERE